MADWNYRTEIQQTIMKGFGHFFVIQDFCGFRVTSSNNVAGIHKLTGKTVLLIDCDDLQTALKNLNAIYEAIPKNDA